uniref:TLC domain-containing protein n=1 Tax=Macrostomum lignano TaxID=282301 RepID=A0A1I8FMH6_9PLAT
MPLASNAPELRRQSRPSLAVHSGWSQSGQDELYCCSAGGLIDWPSHSALQGFVALDRTYCEWVHIGAGVWLLWFCFGLQSVHMMVQREFMSTDYTTTTAATQWHHGPLMILTQKLSSLALALHDGHLAKRGPPRGAASLAGAIGWDELPSVLDYLALFLLFANADGWAHVFYSDFIAHFTQLHTNSNEDKQYLK